ncbi:ImmA/IrrE family metallo-endopeptidase [Actinomyces gaoshouyii]|uniref:IrrE N-terminal-like domain-containing protein n=1 Tax=Actinomyces gaoshouyii TaxID=1960083 RepID=A0A8H9H7M8_9ACTO|nr:ImmA/IrrE family metallo-endopeptidase [Actinomyces gaoshouyii]GGO95648.1 hypothetical protein GCM10011612_04010 [Actinomyces gaoshouyii]
MRNLRVQQVAADARSALGEDFVSCFYDRVEDALGVEVIVVPLSGDGYSLTLGGHKVVVVGATRRWYRSNFTLAHELGHFLVGGESSHDDQAAENMANAFAADLLMPVERVRSVDWERATAATVAQVSWELGVSTQALEVRLRYLRARPGDEARSALARSTEALLGTSLPSSVATPADVSARVQYSARRRFPERVVTGLRRAIADGKAPQASLSWVLGLPAQGERDDDDEVVDPHELDIELLDGLV